MAAAREGKKARDAVSRGEMGSKSAIMSNDVPRKAAGSMAFPPRIRTHKTSGKE